MNRNLFTSNLSIYLATSGIIDEILNSYLTITDFLFQLWYWTRTVNEDSNHDDPIARLIIKLQTSQDDANTAIALEQLSENPKADLIRHRKGDSHFFFSFKIAHCMKQVLFILRK